MEPLFHGSFPQFEGPQHVSLFVYEGGSEQFQGVYPFLFAHQVPLAYQVFHDVKMT